MRWRHDPHLAQILSEACARSADEASRHGQEVFPAGAIEILSDYFDESDRIDNVSVEHYHDHSELVVTVNYGDVGNGAVVSRFRV